MIPAPIPPNETERLVALKKLGVLNTPAEERFDRITRRAMELFHVPISTISIIDDEREWFKSRQGLDKEFGPRTESFCGHALLTRRIMIVEDALEDIRFKDNPSVVGPPYIRFYAGVPLVESETKLPIGVFCIKDTKPRKFSLDDIEGLIHLATEAEQELNKK